jgi:hypothetical protein
MPGSDHGGAEGPVPVGVRNTHPPAGTAPANPGWHPCDQGFSLVAGGEGNTPAAV